MTARYTIAYPPFSGNPDAKQFATFDDALDYLSQHQPWDEYGKPQLVGSYWDDDTDGLTDAERAIWDTAASMRDAELRGEHVTQVRVGLDSAELRFFLRGPWSGHLSIAPCSDVDAWGAMGDGILRVCEPYLRQPLTRMTLASMGADIGNWVHGEAFHGRLYHMAGRWHYRAVAA